MTKMLFMICFAMLLVGGISGSEKILRKLESHKACYVRELFDLFADERAERKDLSKEVKKIKTAINLNFGKTVAFTARLSSISTYSSRSVIQFNKVITNIGNGLRNGIFYCPESGLYLIHASIMTNAKGASAIIQVNNKLVAHVYSGPGSQAVGYITGSNMIFLRLKKGDTVAVKPYHSSSTTYHNKGTFFSGLKIQTM